MTLQTGTEALGRKKTPYHVEQWEETWSEFNRAIRSIHEEFHQWHWMYKLARSMLVYLYYQSRCNVLVDTLNLKKVWRPTIPFFAVVVVLFCGWAYFYSFRTMVMERCCSWDIRNNKNVPDYDHGVSCSTCSRGHVHTVLVVYFITMILYNLVKTVVSSPGVALPCGAAYSDAGKQTDSKDTTKPVSRDVSLKKWSSLNGQGGCCCWKPVWNIQDEFERVNLYNVGQGIHDVDEAEKDYYYPFPGFSYCDKCNIMRPPRCHHCSTCNRCILQMDHHCPWVDNCIGYNNYRSFVLLVLYLVLSCWYGVFLLVEPYREMVLSAVVQDRELSSWSAVMHIMDLPRPVTLCRQAFSNAGIETETLLKILFPLLFGVGIVMSSFLAWHVFYICSGRTTLEHRIRLYQIEANAFLRLKSGLFRKDNHHSHHCQRLVNPFDQGWRANVKQVFGPNLFLVLLPVGVRPPDPFLPRKAKST